MEQVRIPDDLFWGLLEKNAGLFHPTSKAISLILGKPYQQGHVRTQAGRNPERLKAIKDSVIDMAEAVVLKTICNEAQPKLAFEASKYYLDCQAKDRGYGKSSEFTLKDETNIPYAEAIKHIKEKIKSNPKLIGVMATS